MQGVHPNPELRELWRTHRAKQFNAELLEPAPRGLSELEMARWLVERERQWITRHGGLHKNINHVYPKIVLNVEARAQLEAERRLHSEEYKKLEQSVYLLDERADGFQDKIVYLEKMIESASKFWGFFTSTEEKRKADLARVKIENIRNAIWETRERRDAIHRQFVKLKEKLYPA